MYIQYMRCSCDHDRDTYLYFVRDCVLGTRHLHIFDTTKLFFDERIENAVQKKITYRASVALI
jgi:hypothetical protein